MSLSLPRATAAELRRRDVHVATWLAAAMALAWASVLGVKLVSTATPSSWGHALVAFVGYGVYEYTSVWAMLMPLLLHRRLPLAAAAPGDPQVATALAPLLALWGVSTLFGTLSMFVLTAVGDAGFEATLRYLPYMGVRQGTLALLLVLLAELRLRHERASAALHESTLHNLALRRELDEAHLAVLSAQIEPHFLFNTLANVRRLLRTEPPAARQLLAQLRRYLQEALPRLRESHSTLGREAELVRAYLGVHQVRMGPRLAFDVDVPEALREHPLPPMLLLTLVENAIKHGLAPQVEGGTIRVHARHEPGEAGDELVLTVADTGLGMDAGLGSGTGLANLRSRLRTQHGPAARLTLRMGEPRGVVAEVRLPWQPSSEKP